jgi:tetratricopeptide (TPR) repeat protein
MCQGFVFGLFWLLPLSSNILSGEGFDQAEAARTGKHFAAATEAIPVGLIGPGTHLLHAASCSRLYAASETLTEENAAIRLQRGEYARVIADCTKALRGGATRALVYYARALAYAAAGDNDKALEDLSEAIRRWPTQPLFYLVRGTAYRARQDTARAIADCNKALRLGKGRRDANPSFRASAYTIRAGAWRLRKDLPRAIADSSKAVRLDPTSAIAHVERAEVYALQGKYAEGLAEVEQATRINPDSASAAALGHYLRVQQEEYESALRDAEAMARLRPGSAWGIVEPARAQVVPERNTANVASANNAPPGWPLPVAAPPQALPAAPVAPPGPGREAQEKALHEWNTTLQFAPGLADAYRTIGDLQRAGNKRKAWELRTPSPAPGASSRPANFLPGPHSLLSRPGSQE